MYSFLRVQAVDASADALGEIKLVQEKQIITQYFNEIAQDTGFVICFSHIPLCV